MKQRGFGRYHDGVLVVFIRLIHTETEMHNTTDVNLGRFQNSKDEFRVKHFRSFSGYKNTFQKMIFDAMES